MKSYALFVVVLLSFSGFLPAQAQGDQWIPITGADKLRGFMDGLKTERRLPSGEMQTAEYKSDGTGVLFAWGASYPRIWEVKGQDQLCFTAEWKITCVKLEVNSAEEDLYRVQDVATGKYTEFRVTNRQASVADDAPDPGSKGGTGVVSADEVARKLANPNTPLASLKLKLQYRAFEGDLPNADNQDSWTAVFQPSLPFPLANGDLIFLRPAIPFILEQPAFDAVEQDFDSVSGLGDITFDLAYGRTTKTGLVWAAGLVSTLPTATKDELGADRFTLGPELLFGKLGKKHVLGVFPNHQWDVGGSGDADINLTTVQLFAISLPGGGWNLGTVPVISYDHVADEWTVPLNLSVGRTVVMGGRPWKIGMEFNYFVEQPDSFGPEWSVEFNIAPVVENVLAKWFKH